MIVDSGTNVEAGMFNRREAENKSRPHAGHVSYIAPAMPRGLLVPTFPACSGLPTNVLQQTILMK
jgi:hypothetical protein